jgi:arabinogalactan oligomer/maltooligosaccharide transport system substrate-binding protein
MVKSAKVVMDEATPQFGKYRVLGELGRGGFATVFRAVDTTLDREVALKILHPQLLADSAFVQRFRQEARTLAALRHPQIITVYEVGEAEGRLFIAMDLAHGPSLAQSIARRVRVPWSEALALLRPVAEALDYAHRQGIVHRDLKPANILLDQERGALLTDFGFARLMSESSLVLSMSGGVLGTPGYIAPEVWDGSVAEAPADIYALGCIAYEMLTGEALFRGQTPIQVMRAHDRGPAFPEAWQDDVPPGMAAVLGKALAHDPVVRYSSAMALWHALNDLEASAQKVREDEAQAAVVAQWRAEAEAALAAGELSAARMAIGHWLALAPDDPAAQAARAQMERMSGTPAKVGAARPITEPAREMQPASVHARSKSRKLSTRTIAAGGFGIAIFLIGVMFLISGGQNLGRIFAPTATPTVAATPKIIGEVTLWHAGGDEGKVINQLIDQVKKDNPDATITVLEVPFDQIYHKFETEAAGGGGPDLFMVLNIQLGNEVRAGLLRPLDDKLSGYINNDLPVSVQGCTVDGRLYCVPQYLETVVLFYNKDKVKDVPKTTDDLLMAVKGGAKLGIIRNSFHNFGFWGAFGGKLFDDSNKCIADQGGFTEAMQYLKDLKAAGAQFFNDDGSAEQAFKTGELDMIIQGSWKTSDFGTALGDKLAVAPIPAGPKGPAAPLVGTDGFYINKSTKNVDGAVALALYLISPASEQVYMNVASHIPADKTVEISDPLTQGFADAIATGFPWPLVPEMNNYWPSFDDMVNKVIENGADPQEEIATACKAMNHANNK